jgi:hypothetical protein
LLAILPGAGLAFLLNFILWEKELLSSAGETWELLLLKGF